jgi:DNA-binding NarL/FixJ family response regulator
MDHLEPTAPTLLCCERHGHWAAAFRQLHVERLLVREVRGLSALAAELQQAPQAICALELTATNRLAALEWLLSMRRRAAKLAVIVLSTDGERATRALVEEWGIVAYLENLRSAVTVRDALRRYSGRFPTVESDDPLAALPRWAQAGEPRAS